MCPGIRATGWIAYFTSTPSALKIRHLAQRMLRLRDPPCRSPAR